MHYYDVTRETFAVLKIKQNTNNFDLIHPGSHISPILSRNKNDVLICFKGLSDWIPKFIDEKMDLEALMLLNESDLGKPD